MNYLSKLLIFMGLMTTPLMGIELAKKQVIHLGNGAEPKELDPSKSTGVPESHIVDNIFEGLTALDPIDLSPLPGVAESWEESKDAKTYTFKLRKTVWSDGTPITAQTFVDSWLRALSKELASEYAYQLFYIKGAEAYHKDNSKKNAAAFGAKAKDKQTLVVELNAPTPFFLRLTAFHTLFPVPLHQIKRFTDQAWTKPENFVGNGPFVLKEWILNKHVKLVPNPKYWDKAQVKLDEAYFHPIENQETEERNFFAGMLHRTNEVPVLKIPVHKRAMQKAPSKYHPYKEYPYLGTYFYRFNVTKKPFNDPKVRRALALAIDRKLIVDRVTRGGEQPALAYTPPNTGGYIPKDFLNASADQESIAEAKKLLAEAGYKDPKKFPEFEILFNTSEKHRKVALAIQQMWKKNLGIKVKLYNQEWKVYLNTQRKLDYSVSRAGWIGDYADPNTFLDMFVTDGGNNQTGWSNKAYDALIDKAAKTTSHEERLKIFAEAEALLMKELPILPIYIYTRPMLVSEKLKLKLEDGQIIDYKSNIQDRVSLKHYVLAK